MSGICAVWRKGNPRHVVETLASMTAGLLRNRANGPARRPKGMPESVYPRAFPDSKFIATAMCCLPAMPSCSTRRN